MARYKHYIGLGIAGNFALHLEQAGEAEDFKDIMTADEAAPKGMFPTYLPKKVYGPKEQLFTYPFSMSSIKHPGDELNIQAEPEVALICKLEYQVGKLHKIIPTHFGAYNDCSIRVAGAQKISDKKNWGLDSKGISETLIELDKFEDGGNIHNYSIVSFLKRDGEIHQYGENAELSGYSYFNEKLIDWMTDQINNQEDFGPLEPLADYLFKCDNPDEAVISIGATRYTEYGEKTYLQKGDEVIVVVYNHQKVSLDEVKTDIEHHSYHEKDMSVLAQSVI
jgi:hypothetical protein